jgi:ABC-type amino acid transport substrate-binding protein
VPPAAAVRTPASQAASETRVSKDPDDPPPYILTGDLAEIRKKGIIRLLVTTPDHLARAGDPKIDEEAFARKLNLRAVSVVVSDRSALVPALNAGDGDVIVASLAITPERSREIAIALEVVHVEVSAARRASAQ